MVQHVCAACLQPFTHRKSNRKFCSIGCRNDEYRRRGADQPGTIQPGTDAHNRLPVGSVTIRRRKVSGERRAWVKVAEPNLWVLRARVVWEATNGPVPDGMVVHHVNRDTLDDSLANLVLESRSGHLSEHRPEFEPKRRERAAAARWGTHAPSTNSDI